MARMFSRPHTVIGTALSIVFVSILAVQKASDISPLSFTGMLEEDRFKLLGEKHQLYEFLDTFYVQCSYMLSTRSMSKLFFQKLLNIKLQRMNNGYSLT
ncbi:hypothetical protein AAHE18_11G126100 [Arachis hypogaea]